MGIIILSGGGDLKQTFEINQYFVQLINKDKPLLYLPIAGDLKVRTYESSLVYIEKMFRPLGIHNITMWTDINGKTIEELNEFSAVYIGGGNTLSLLNDLKESGFDQLLSLYFHNGGTIYGQSAGAIVLGKNNILHSCGENYSFYVYAGLNLVANYSIWCHYSTKDDLLIEACLKKNQQTYILLPDGVAVVFNEGDLSVIAKSKPKIATLNKFGKMGLKEI
ncbi:Type 1 glutamine amidotransferase-like domain-containing protein [Niallia sp. HCP3S3_B10]|uniref:Type 1 glutamine amidotransferase-like domain-containing protein n=1 Tax=Niallia sp. HCP3S3_B10 TaxID=3438944 RepID=UPI003F8AE09E